MPFWNDGTPRRNRRSRKSSATAQAQGSTQSTHEYRLQVQLLRSKVRRLELSLGQVVQTSEAAMAEMRIQQVRLRQEVERSQTDFAKAWDSFDNDSNVAARVRSLDHDQRARRWLLATK